MKYNVAFKCWHKCCFRKIVNIFRMYLYYTLNVFLSAGLDVRLHFFFFIMLESWFISATNQASL